MKFWSNGRQFDTEKMQAADKIRLLSEVEADLEAANNAIAEFNVCTNVREFALRHFGGDGSPSLYIDRFEVANRLEAKLDDLCGSDRVLALRAMGIEPIGTVA